MHSKHSGRSRSRPRRRAEIAVVAALAVAGPAGAAHATLPGPQDGGGGPVEHLVTVARNTTAYSTPYRDALRQHPVKPGTYLATCEAQVGMAGPNDDSWWSRMHEGTWINNSDMSGGTPVRGGVKMGIGECAAVPRDDHQTQPPVKQSAKVLGWAYRHVNWWAGLYSMDHRLPIASVAYMQSHEPPRGAKRSDGGIAQGCDCSSFVRWAMAQAGIDVGTATDSIWTANRRLGPLKPTAASANLSTGHVARGWKTMPPGGYRPGDLIFYHVSRMDVDVGHVVLYMGGGKIVQCSGGRGSNMGLPVTSQGHPTGWLRYDRVSG